MFDAKNTGDAAPDGESIALHGVFYYASVDEHIKWRETPEHAQVIEDVGRSPLSKVGLGNARMPGGNISIPNSSKFHVRFCVGIKEIKVMQISIGKERSRVRKGLFVYSVLPTFPKFFFFFF